MNGKDIKFKLTEFFILDSLEYKIIFALKNFLTHME